MWFHVNIGLIILICLLKLFLAFSTKNCNSKSLKTQIIREWKNVFYSFTQTKVKSQGEYFQAPLGVDSEYLYYKENL